MGHEVGGDVSDVLTSIGDFAKGGTADLGDAAGDAIGSVIDGIGQAIGGDIGNAVSGASDEIGNAAGDIIGSVTAEAVRLPWSARATIMGAAIRKPAHERTSGRINRRPNPRGLSSLSTLRTISAGFQSLPQCSAHACNMLISLRRSRRRSTVHSAPTVCHCRRRAWFPAPCSRSTTFRPAHIQEHGIDSPIWSAPHPPQRCRQWPAHHVDVDVFDSDLLLPFSTMAV